MLPQTVAFVFPIVHYSLSQCVVDVPPVGLDAPEPSPAGERHELVGGEGVLQVGVVPVVEHVAGLVPAWKKVEMEKVVFWRNLLLKYTVRLFDGVFHEKSVKRVLANRMFKRTDSGDILLAIEKLCHLIYQNCKKTSFILMPFFKRNLHPTFIQVMAAKNIAFPGNIFDPWTHGIQVLTECVQTSHS